MPITQVKAEIPDRDYWKRQIKCQDACPVHTDARGYVRAIAEGDDEGAYLIARGPNPLASICGRVCGAPCETACRRSAYDKPIAIRALKRYVCERFGPEARGGDGQALVDFLKEASARRGPPTSVGHAMCEGREELLPLLQSLTNQDVPKVAGQSVGIIGGGPAGLAAAHDLALLGFSVTIYEMEPILAGMLATGVPEYRLERKLIEAEVEVIRTMGVEALTNCCIGRDLSFPELRQRHDIVVIAAGAKRSLMLSIPGGDARGVLGGVEFLRDVSLGNPPEIGARVVVIGGGNVAYDVGRTVIRRTAVDTARAAVRRPEVGEVHLCSLESLEEMPADDAEIIEGDEEGIRRGNSLGPKEILTNEAGAVTGVRFQRCTRVFDELNRFNPDFDDSDITEVACDTVLVAIGQAYDISFIDGARDGLKILPNGMIECDAETGTTAAPDVFVAGDLAYGPKLLIHAVASGKSVARAIYKQITGRSISTRDVELHFPVARYEREEGYEKVSRVSPPTLGVRERLEAQDRIVESGFTEKQARLEASRCLNCGVNTIFDGMRCVLCGGCVEVCPESCLRIIPLESLDTVADLGPILESHLEGGPPSEASAIIKDETICIRCALCAERCPTGAITMEEFHFEEKPLCLVD